MDETLGSSSSISLKSLAIRELQKYDFLSYFFSCDYRFIKYFLTENLYLRPIFLSTKLWTSLINSYVLSMWSFRYTTLSFMTSLHLLVLEPFFRNEFFPWDYSYTYPSSCFKQHDLMFYIFQNQCYMVELL